jgi:hypothetical protein
MSIPTKVIGIIKQKETSKISQINQTSFLIDLSENIIRDYSSSNKKQCFSSKCYLTDEDVLERLELQLINVQSQFERCQKKIYNGSKHSKYYRNKLKTLLNAIERQKYDIQIYQCKVYGTVLPTTKKTNSGRNVKPIVRFEHEEFIPGANNKYTKGREIDIGKSIG